MTHHIDIGREGEDIAVSYLWQAGLSIVARNVANPHGKRLGEIDIVARQGKEIVFVEVKTLRARTDGDVWLPEWQVTPAKLKKLERIAQYYLRQSRLENQSYRFDVVAIILKNSGEAAVKHIEHAFL